MIIPQRKTALALAAFALCLVFALPVSAATNAASADQPSDQAVIDQAKSLPPDEYLRAKVLSVDDKGVQSDEVETDRVIDYRVELSDGKDKGLQLTIESSAPDTKTNNRKVVVGDEVVVVKSYQVDGTTSYYLADNYRLPMLAILAGLFFLLAIIFGGVRGFTSVLGLGASVLVILYFIVPRIIAGQNPFQVTLMATFIIAAVSLYLAHGFNRRTTVAFVGTIITLSLSAGIAVAAVSLSRLYGMGSEQALYLQNGDFGNIDLRGLLLGGIMLGVLGVLDDITTAQSAVIEELKRANLRLSFRDLYTRGLSVGKEHIASLVNTLFLAYAGAALPLFLLFEFYKGAPVWFTLNSEVISEEIVRTLIGSVCLILAVPITTALAAAFFTRYPPDEHAHGEPAHHHHH